FSPGIPPAAVTPLQSALFRPNHPSERRPARPPENAVFFWSRSLWHMVVTHAVLAISAPRLALTAILIMRSPDARAYTDLALTPVHDGEDEELELLTRTAGAREAIAHVKKVAALTHAAPAE